LFPSTGAAEWIRWMMKLNPMTYALAALRRTLQGDLLAPDAYLPSLPASLVIVALFAGATLLIAFAIVHRPATHRLG
jgi:ABC-2 type transport system permease protein